MAASAQEGIREPIQGIQSAPTPILLDGFKRVRCARKLQISFVPFLPLDAHELSGFVQMLNPLREPLELFPPRRRY